MMDGNVPSRILLKNGAQTFLIEVQILRLRNSFKYMIIILPFIKFNEEVLLYLDLKALIHATIPTCVTSCPRCSFFALKFGFAEESVFSEPSATLTPDFTGKLFLLIQIY